MRVLFRPPVGVWSVDDEMTPPKLVALSEGFCPNHQEHRLRRDGEWGVCPYSNCGWRLVDGEGQNETGAKAQRYFVCDQWYPLPEVRG